VTSLAYGLRWPALPPDAPSDVLRRGHGFQVGWVDAGNLAAQVVQGQTGGDGAVLQLVAVAVSLVDETVGPESAVAVGLACFPRPARVRFVHLEPEALNFVHVQSILCT
jgi:hypothetical protein